MGKVSKRGNMRRAQKGRTKVTPRARGREESLTHGRPSVFGTRGSVDRQTHVELTGREWVKRVQRQLCQQCPGHGSGQWLAHRGSWVTCQRRGHAPVTHLLRGLRRNPLDWRQGQCQIRGIWVSRVFSLTPRRMLSRGTGRASQQSQCLQKSLSHEHKWREGKQVPIFPVNTAKKPSTHPEGRSSENGLLHVLLSILSRKHSSMIHGSFSLPPYFSTKLQGKWPFQCSGSS